MSLQAHTFTKKRVCAGCGKHAPYVRINKSASRWSRNAKKGKAVRMKGHDLCYRCWRSLQDQIERGC